MGIIIPISKPYPNYRTPKHACKKMFTAPLSPLLSGIVDYQNWGGGGRKEVVGVKNFWDCYGKRSVFCSSVGGGEFFCVGCGTKTSPKLGCGVEKKGRKVYKLSFHVSSVPQERRKKIFAPSPKKGRTDLPFANFGKGGGKYLREFLSLPNWQN